MKKLITLFLSMLLLSLVTQVRAESSTESGTNYFENSFTEATDTVGWTVTGDGLGVSTVYNWTWNDGGNRYMKSGRSSNATSTDTYTLTTPTMAIGTSGADLSFTYAKVSAESSFMVYVLENGTRHLLLSNLIPTGHTYTWYDAEASLSAYAGQTIQLVFEHTNIHGYVYLDDIKVEAPPLCPTAKHLGLASLQTTSATFSWDNSTSDTYVMLLSSVAQLDPETAPASDILYQGTITATANGTSGWTYTKTGLVEGTQYYLYLKSDCSADAHGIGAWSKELIFQTPCSAQAVPYTMDFNALSPGDMPSCWISKSSYETQPQVIDPLSGDAVNTTKVLSMANNMNSDGMLILPLFSNDVSGLMMNLEAKASLEGTSIQVGLTNDLTDVQNMVTMFTQALTTDWNTYTFFFDNAFSGTSTDYYIILYVSSGQTASTNAFNIYLDNVSVDLTPSCLFPIQFTVSDLGDQSCTLNWIDKNTTVTDYTIEYTATGGTAQTVNTTTNPYILTGLTPDTEYSIRVRSNCNATDQSEYSISRTVRTLKSPIVVTTETAGLEDFEGATNTLTMLESNSYNVWTVGTALSASPAHAMYISGDYGATAGTQEASKYSYAYAYVNIDLPAAGDYKLSFNWQGLSYSDYSSYMALYLTTPEKEIELNSSWSDSESGTTMIGERLSNSENNTWEATQHVINVTEAGIYRLVFYRKTSSSYRYEGDYTAVDDIRIKYISCYDPTDLTQTSTSSTSVGLSWNSTASNFTVKAFTTPLDPNTIDATTELPAATVNTTTTAVDMTGLTPATMYYFYVQAQCDATHNSDWIGPLVALTDCDLIDLPYSTDFNSEIDGTMPLCWIGSDNATSVSNNPSSTIDINGTPVLELDGTSDSYVILPEFSSSISKTVLEFDYVNRSSSRSEDMIVGYFTNVADASTFVALKTLEASSSNVHVFLTFESVDPSIFGRFAITEAEGSSTRISYAGTIDNLEAYEYPSCWPIEAFKRPSDVTETGLTLSWEPNTRSASRNFTVEYGQVGFVPGSSDGTIVNVTDTFCVISGLTASTFYDAYVTTDCGSVDGTSISVMGTFKTLVPPIDGTNYSCDFEDATENANWTIESTPGANSWEIGTQSSYAGTNGLYVVDSEGNLGYNQPNDDSWAYRFLHCTPGLYTVTLDYKCEGQSNYDYMNCVIIPEAYLPEAGNDEGITSSSIPDGWFTGDPIKMNLEEGWVRYRFQFPVDEETNVTLAIHWHNNSSSYYDPASVDNITVSKVNCRPAYEVSLDSLSQTTANLIWTSDIYDHFEVIVDTVMHLPENLDTLVAASFVNRTVDTEALKVTGLEVATNYYAYIRNHCSDTTVSEWSEVYPFTTLCNVKTLPFSDDFESTELDATPQCWTFLSGDDVKISASETYSLNQALYLNTADASSIRIALPTVNMPLDIENYQLVFYAYRVESSIPSDLLIALNSAEDVSSDDLNSLKQEPIAIPASQEGFWKRIVVPFEHPTDLMTGQPITMGDEQVIFMTIPGPAKLYIDAIKIEEIPACAEPYDVAIDSVLARSIYYSWDGPATNYEIQCISANNTDTITHLVSGDTAIVSGLNPHTAYNVHIRSLCTPTETSTWSQTLSFTTECAVETLPYVEDFSTLTTGNMPVCWDVINDGYYDEWNSLNDDSENYMYLLAGSEYNPYIFSLTSPEIDLTTATYGTLSFDLKGEDNSALPAAMVILDQTTGLTDTLMTSILYLSSWNNFAVSIQPYVGHVIRLQLSVSTFKNTEGSIYFDNITVEDKLYVAPPTSLTISDPTTNSVVVHVNEDAAATSHNVAVVPENVTFDPLTATITSMTLPDSVIVTGLLPNTYYKVYAQTINGSYESQWMGVTRFNTSCAALNLPLLEDFETLVNNTPTLPLCWTADGTVSADQNHPTLGLGDVLVARTAKFISPEIVDELNTAEVYFNGYASSQTPIIVSVCSDPLDMSTKLAVDTITVSDDNSQVFNVDFSAVPAGYHYVVFENDGSTSVYLDNIVVRTYATCRYPEAFTIGNIEKGTANILITDSVATSFDIYYGLSSEVDFNDLTATVSNVSDSAWITGLGSNMVYTVFVRTNCGGAQGQWIGPLTFTSACNTLTLTEENPYIEDLSTLTATTYDLPACWTVINNSRSYTAPYAKQYYSRSSSSLSYIQVESGLKDSLYVVLPEYANALNTLRWEFSLELEDDAVYSASDRCMMLGYMTDPTDETTFVSFKRIVLSNVTDLDYSNFNIDLRYADIPAEAHYLAFRISDSNYYFKINGIKVSNNNDCAEPRLSIEQINGSALTVGINPVASATRVDLILYNEGKTYADTILNLDATTKSYTFTALTRGTMYYVKARSYCGTTMSDWSEPIAAIVSHEAVTTYPYTCNFEDALENDNWLMFNGDLSNQWIIGSDPNGVHEGSNGLYVSENHSTATYDGKNHAFTWATRSLHMIPGAYQVSFMAKTGGSAGRDFMRAFVVDSKYQLLPCNYETSELDVFNFTELTAEAEIDGFVDLLGEQHSLSLSDWALYTYRVVVTDTMDAQLAFLWRNNTWSNGQQPAACVDNISILYDNCPAPLDLNFVKTKNDYIQVSSIDALEIDTVHLHYAVVLRDSTFTPTNIVATTTVLSGDTATLSGLAPLTDYDLYTARTCADGSVGAWSEPMPFKTRANLGSMPYFCGFEPSEAETSAWTFYNDDTNAWIIDSMAPRTGEYSMYISDDNKNPSYTANTEQYSYAVRTIHFEPGTYDMSFAWKGEAESDYDYIMVGLTPDSFIPEMGSDNFNGTTLDYEMSAPAGSMIWGQFSSSTIWQTANETFNITSSCDMNLIFAWINDGGSGDDPSAVIDDITITKQFCSMPVDIQTTHMTDSSATISWMSDAMSTHLTVHQFGVQVPIVDTTLTDTFFIVNGLSASTDYSYELYSICSATNSSSVSNTFSFTTPCETYTLPFSENFEANLSRPGCWQSSRGFASLNGTTDGSTLTGTGSAWGHQTAENSISAHQSLNVDGTSKKEWLITPSIALDKEATLSFDLALTDWGNWNAPENESGVDDKFAVMISRDNGLTWEALSSWTETSEAGHKYFDIPSTFEKQFIEIPSSTEQGNIQIAFYAESTLDNADNYIRIDNVNINCLASDTLIISDTTCQGYAYNRNGFNIPADDVTTGTFTKLIAGDASTCDQITALHLFVNPSYQVTENATICQGQSYLFGSVNLTESGQYIKTLSSVNGCDSIVNLNLTVTKLIVNIDTMICEGNFIEIGGEQVSMAGIYSDTTRNAEGCDSVTNIILKVLPTNSTMDTTICEGDAVTLGSMVYTTPGTYTETLKNVLDCDSVVTLNLTVIPSDTVYVDQFCANSTYNFRGTLLTAPGDYTDTVHNYMGSNCDYVYKLTLNETMPDTVEISDQFCEGISSYNEYGFSINDPESKDYIVTKTSSVTGCDSVTILHLNKVATVYGSIAQTICDNESYTFGGRDYYAAGTYDHTFTSLVTGCDSIVTLTLTVNPTYTVDVSESITTEQLPYTNLSLVVPEGTDVGTYDYTIESSTQAGCDSIINLTLTITKGNGLSNVNVGTLNFYPNVVKGGDNVTITTDFSEHERQEMSIRLYDATGKLVAAYKPQSTGAMSYTMPGVSGMYYLRLETKSGKTFSGKLIIL